MGCKRVLGIRDTIVLPLLQNPQKTLLPILTGGNPRGSTRPPLPPRLTAGEGRGGLGTLSSPVQRDLSVFSDGFQLAEYRGTQGLHYKYLLLSFSMPASIP